jgi:peptide/nickel transport system substrate-binding protein/oligopeptide transport system substrate-binding protein
MTVTQQVYDGLTAFDEHLNIVPALAHYWQISDRGQTYTFELRPGARFHNGRPVTAEDCVFSLERLVSPGLNQDNFHYFSQIVGAEAFRAGRAKHVEGLKAIDERTFQIRFTTPFVHCLSVLSMFCSKILPKREVLEQGEAFFHAPIGTGPFRFSEWVALEKDPAKPSARRAAALRLAANPDYFGARPHLDELVFRLPAPANAERPPIEEIVDVIAAESIPDTALPDWVRVEAPQLALYYLVLPTSPPFGDPRVRRALNFALDKRSFIGEDERLSALVADSIVPPGIPGFIPARKPYEHDLRKARALMAEAGFAEGRGLPPLEFIVDPLYFDLGNRGCLESCLGQIGVKVEWLRAGRRVERDEPGLSGRPYVLVRGWIADFPDPDNFLRPLFHSHSPQNANGYSNPEVDRLLDQAWTVTSYSERIQLYRRIEEKILQDSPIIPVFYGRQRVLVHPNVRGFGLSQLGLHYLQARRIWLANQAHPKARL